MNWSPTVSTGWGRVKRAHMLACAPGDEAQVRAALSEVGAEALIAHGAGRSYGDAALNDGGRALFTRDMARILAFEPSTGDVICEPGVSFRQLLDTLLPHGFLAPVTPGTGFATLGGAVAHDVHGKNHEVAGAFGDHVQWMEVLLPDGRVARVDPQHEPELFAATVGGLGLTGIILRLGLRLQAVPSNAVRLREWRMRDLDDFLAAFSGESPTFSVGWIDALARGARLGRGVLETAAFSDVGVPVRRARTLTLPVDLPGWVLNPWSVGAFNAAYYRRVPARGRERLLALDRFLYPLDAIHAWNRLYGRRGFHQFQCVLPEAESPRALPRLLEAIARTRAASFLAVLKRMGGEGRGYLSFPMRGHTLALDFPSRAGTDALLRSLEAITLEHGGRVYLAKDASLSPAACRAMYPRLPAFQAVLERIDPAARLNSDLARRLGIRAPAAVRRPPLVSPNNNERTTDPGRIQPMQPERQTSQSERRPRYTVEDAKRLDVPTVADLFCAHLNPGQYHFLKLLGFHRVLIDRAEGMYYYTRDGRRILDFFGGFGSLALGHNHPRVLDTRRRFQDEQRHEIAIAFMSQYAAALAANLADLAPEDLDMVFLGSTGSEAVEAALKLAERAQGPARATVLHATRSFHGKTRGALSVTDSDFYRGEFRLLDNTRAVPFGDAAALAAALADDPSIGTLILETVQGGAGIVSAPPGYWDEVRRLCDRHDVLWIADEVQCGVGRTGRFFAFEHEGVAPDIVTLAKSLGGGKCAMGAMIARRAVYTQAYGSPKTALIHGPATFGGIGEACCTAIEALNVLYDERLIENAAAQGAHLLARLEALRAKYPRLIKEVRGQGLMVGVEFGDLSQALRLGLRQMVALLDEKLKGSLCGFVGSLLLRDYDILVAFTEYNRNVVRLEPPLIVTRAQVDTFVDALDDLLGRGLTGIVRDYLRSQARPLRQPA